jgi:peptidyl-prolyl cis-trans isomerase SurA
MRALSLPKTILIAATVMGSAVVSSSAVAQETLIDRIAAVVDGTPLMYSVVMDKVAHGPLILVSDFPADEKSPPFQRALQDLINLELINKKNKEMENDVRPEELESEINQYIQGRGLTREQLTQYLAREGKTYEDYKETFRVSLLVNRFQGRVINPLIKINDKDIENYFIRKTGTSSDFIQLELRMILISVGSDASPDMARAKQELAQEVFQKIQGGASFEEMARVYSDDPGTKASGGLMPKILLRDLSPNIRTAVEGLDAGRVTSPTRTDNGFLLFYVQNKSFALNEEFEKKKKELEFELRAQEIQGQTRRWLAGQRQRSKIEIFSE